MKQSYGFRSWAGLGAEGAWGEAAPRTHFTEVISDSLRAVRDKVFSKTFRGRSKRRYARGRETAAGSLAVEAAFEGLEPLWRQIFGEISTQAVPDGQGGTSHYLHTMIFSEEPPAGLSVELHRDAFDPALAGGAGAPSSFLYAGCRVDEAVFALEPDAYMRLECSMLARNESLAGASTPSFMEAPLMDFSMAALEIGGEAREAQSFELSVRHHLQGDRRALGRREILTPLPGDKREVSGSVKLFFDRLDDARRFAESQESSLRLALTGPAMPSGEPYAFTLDCPRIVLTGETPVVDAAGALSMTLNFEALEPAPGGSPLTAALANALAEI
jgi:hypothetical protein